MQAWGVSSLEPLAGGQGTTYRSESVVLKPVGNTTEAEWLASVLDELNVPPDIRIITPIRAADGRWVVDGWSAWEHLEGLERAGEWREALAVSDAFHAATAAVQWSSAINTDHAWAVGAAFAWGEADLDIPPRFKPVVDRCLSRCQPLERPNQLIHSDICNNILFHDSLPPAVIDISPQWRPKRFADAIAVVDTIGWFGGGPDAVAALRDEIGEQLAIRAALFRLGSAVVLFEQHEDRLAGEVAVYERIVDLITARHRSRRAVLFAVRWQHVRIRERVIWAVLGSLGHVPTRFSADSRNASRRAVAAGPSTDGAHPPDWYPSSISVGVLSAATASQ